MAGNSSSASSVLSMAITLDDGIASFSTTTNDNTPTITGSAEAGSTVEVFSDSVSFTTTAVNNGAFSSNLLKTQVKEVIQ